jgi:regulator of protease activity HflC (stomatin/prohibitin superfamily)
MPQLTVSSLIIIVVVGLLAAWALYALGKWLQGGGAFATVYEWEHGLVYRNGRFERVLPPGRHLARSTGWMSGPCAATIRSTRRPWSM